MPPLVTSVRVYGEILQETLDEADDPANVELMKNMNVQIDRLTGFINALLDTTKISEGHLPLNREVFGLNDSYLGACRRPAAYHSQLLNSM